MIRFWTSQVVVADDRQGTTTTGVFTADPAQAGVNVIAAIHKHGTGLDLSTDIRGPLDVAGLDLGSTSQIRLEECVVGQRAEKLRRHDRVETALHRRACGCISGADALVKVENRGK